MYDEPDITVNGVTLTTGQAMAVRCALQSFASDLVQTGLGDDAHGKAMVKGYLRNIHEVNELIALKP